MPEQNEASATQLQAQLDHAAANLQLPHTRLSRSLDRIVRRIGDAVSWVWIVLLGVVVLNVVLRYVFGEGRIEFEELQWHLYSLGFLCGLAYCLESDDHIRVDFLRGRYSPRLQGWIELYGLLLLLLPFVALILIYSVPFIAGAYAIGEVSVAPGGLPYRWAIKGSLFAAFALLALAAFSRLLRVSALLFSFPAAIGDESPAANSRGER